MSDVLAQQRKIVNRLKRARGQLGAVIEGIENGKSCTDVVTQLAAVNTAVERAGYLIISCAMQSAMTAESSDADTSSDADNGPRNSAVTTRRDGDKASSKNGQEAAAHQFLEGEQLSPAQLEKLFMML